MSRPTMEEALAAATDVYVQEWLNAHPEVLLGVTSAAVPA